MPLTKVPFILDCESPGCKKLARWVVHQSPGVIYASDVLGNFCTAHANALVNSSTSEQDGQHGKETRPKTPR
jgi:hypothetical protein